VYEYSLGKEHDQLSVIWEICIFIKVIAIYPTAFYCSSKLFIAPKELNYLEQPCPKDQNE